MKFSEFFYTEMPITKFNLVGDWGEKARKYGYRDKDIGILTNPKAVDKIHKKWSNTKENFDLYFVRSKYGRRNSGMGEITAEQVKEIFGLDIYPEPDSITVIFTGNTDTVPMTHWMIAHRMAHTLIRNKTFEKYFENEIHKDFQELMQDIYGRNYSSGYGYERQYNIRQDIVKLANHVATMKSARERKIRNYYEFIFELVAQYIITGKIKFNPLPGAVIKRRRMAWGHPADEKYYKRVSDVDFEDANEHLQGLAVKYEYYLDNIFGELVGKILVM